MKNILLLICFVFTLVSTPALCLAAPETVSQGKQVSIHYTLTLDDGTVVTTTKNSNPLTYIQGTRKIVPGLEKAMIGLKVGDAKKVSLSPEEGYGEFQSGKIVEVKKSEVNGNLEVGSFVEGTRPTGELIRSRIVEVKSETVVLDFNHPMAGKNLHYDVSVVGFQDSPASASPRKAG